MPVIPLCRSASDALAMTFSFHFSLPPHVNTVSFLKLGVIFTWTRHRRAVFKSTGGSVPTHACVQTPSVTYSSFVLPVFCAHTARYTYGSPSAPSQEPACCRQPSVSVGSMSKESTNHGSKYEGEQISRKLVPKQ